VRLRHQVERHARAERTRVVLPERHDLAFPIPIE
jgi:hypothetical protein